MKNAIVTILIILLIIFTSCTYKQQTYVGESANWKAKYTVTLKRKFLSNKTIQYDSLVLTYKKFIPRYKQDEEIKYSLKSSCSRKRGNFYFKNLANNKSYTIQSSSSGTSVEDENKKIELTIESNKVIEYITLLPGK